MEGMSKSVLVISSMASAMMLACMTALLMTATPGASKARTVTLVGAGDIAGCDFKQDRKTARLLGKIPGTVFNLGDSAYPDGIREQFRNCYHPTWGKYKKAHQTHGWQPRVQHLRGEALLRLLRMACWEANPRLLLLRARLLAHSGPKQQLQGGRWV
jgi:hypothetical protein